MHLAFLLDLQSYQVRMGKERMKWAARVGKARRQGVLVEYITKLVKELGRGKHEIRQDHNIMNQLRALVHLPHFHQVDLLMGERTDCAARRGSPRGRHPALLAQRARGGLPL